MNHLTKLSLNQTVGKGQLAERKGLSLCSTCSFISSLVSCIILLTLIMLASFLTPSLIAPQPLAYAQTVPSYPVQNLSNNTGLSASPQIALSDNQTIYVVWTDNSSGNSDIYFKGSTDNGTSFGSTENLSNSPGMSTDPQLAVYQNNLYVTWTDNSSGNSDSYFKRSTDNGTSFGSTENLSNSPGMSTDPQLAVYQNNLYVTWTDSSSGNSDIYFKGSTDNGTSFRGTNNISKNNTSYSSAPHMAANGSNVYVVWQDKVSGNNEIFLRLSTTAGEKFGGTKNISKNSTGDSVSPQVASIGNSVYVIWSDTTTSSGKSDIFFRPSNNSGDTFRGIKSISRTNGSSYDPKIILSGTNLYVLWEDRDEKSSTFDLVFRASSDGGHTFTDKEDVGKYIGRLADYGQIAALGNDVYIVWSDSFLPTNPPKYEIFLRASSNNGTNFHDAINLSRNSERSISPQMTLSDDRTVFIVWSDVGPGDGEIYFTKLKMSS